MSDRHIQKLDFAKIAIALLLVFVGSAFAQEQNKGPSKDCDIASEATKDNAKGLSLMVAEQIANLEQEYKKRGQDLRVVLVGRGANQSLNKLEILGNNNFVRPDRSKSKVQVYVPTLLNDMTANEFEQSSLYKEIQNACKKYSAGQSGPPSKQVGSSRNFRAECVMEAIKHSVFPKEQGVRGTFDYFHVGMALKNHPMTDKEVPGYWTMVHQLKPSCRRHDQEEFTLPDFDKEKPYIYEESLMNYFLEKLDEYIAVVIVPSPEIQRSIEKLILGPKEKRIKFTGNRYNAAALVYQKGRRNDQNSNQWVAEIIAASQNPSIVNRSQAQDLLREQGFMPSKLNAQSDLVYSLGMAVDAFTNNFLFGWDSIDSVDLKGHGLLDKGIVEVVTVRSIQNYLADNNMLQTEVHVKIPQQLVRKDDEYEEVKEEKKPRRR
jgi:hypothetical protein